METSSKRQKQKLTLIESHRLARNTLRQLPFLPKSPLKRFSLIGAGILAGLSIPVLAIASQQAPSTDSGSNTQSTDVHVKSSTSPDTGEVFSTVEVNSDGSEGAGANAASPTTGSDPNVDVTINGQQVPLVDGSVSQTIVNENSSTLEVDVTVDHSSTSSSSSSSSTDISIESSSSSTGDTNTTRGSPRR